MLLEKIPVGKTLEIFVDREEYRYRMVSKVEDTNAQRVCVTALTSNGRYFQFMTGDRIRIVYRDQEVMWEWDRVDAGLAKVDNTAVHYFVIKDKGKTFNRRNAYRVKLLEDVKMHYYTIPERAKKYSDIPDVSHLTEDFEEGFLEELSTPKSFKGMIKDVSENGVGIYSDSVLEIEDGIYFDLSTPHGELEMKAMVVRKTKATNQSSKYKYYYGCVLTQSDRRLLRYIFDLQREFLKKHNS